MKGGDFMDSLSKNIQNARKQKGLSQEQLAKLLKIGRSTLANYEQGIREPNLETITKIADILDVRPSSLMDWDILEKEDNYAEFLEIKKDEQEKSLKKRHINDIIVLLRKNGYNIQFLYDHNYVELSKEDYKVKILDEELIELQEDFEKYLCFTFEKLLSSKEWINIYTDEVKKQ